MNPSTVTFVGFLTTDDPRWPEALGRVQHDFFHLPGYLAACSSHEGGEPLLFLLDAGSHGMLVPMIKRSLASFGDAYKDFYDAGSPYGYPCPLYWGEGYEEKVPEMHEAFDQFLREQGIVSLFLRLNPFLGNAYEALGKAGDLRSHGPTVYIDLRDEHASWHGINPSNRTFISRMLRNGCEVRIDEWETMDEVIRAYGETMTRLDASPYYFFPRDFFYRLKEGTGDHFHLATCYDPQGDLTGGVFFSEADGLIQYFLTGTFGEFAPVSPGKLLINALRIWGLERGAHTLHLGGGLGAKMDNLYDFKSRLSKSTTTFWTFRKILLPEIYDELCAGKQDECGEYFPCYRKS